MKTFAIYEDLFMGTVEVPDEVAKAQETDEDAIFNWMEENGWPDDEEVIGHRALEVTL